MSWGLKPIGNILARASRPNHLGFDFRKMEPRGRARGFSIISIGGEHLQYFNWFVLNFIIAFRVLWITHIQVSRQSFYQWNVSCTYIPRLTHGLNLIKRNNKSWKGETVFLTLWRMGLREEPKLSLKHSKLGGQEYHCNQHPAYSHTRTNRCMNRSINQPINGNVVAEACNKLQTIAK